MEHACMDAAPSIRVFDEIHELQEMVLRAARGEELGLDSLSDSSLASTANIRASLGGVRKEVHAIRVTKLEFDFGAELAKELQALCEEAETVSHEARAKWDLRWALLVSFLLF